MTTRRRFLQQSTAAVATLATANAIPPISRLAEPRFKLSLAAYSFRDLLPNYRKGDAPTGDEPLSMHGFIDYCATLGIDGAELTSYFLPDPCPKGLALDLKRRAHLQGVTISGGAIGNNFSFPPGPELDEQMAYTESWIKAYAAMGAPVIRVFGGKPAKKDAIIDEAAEESIIANLRTACDIAAKHGVILAVENHDFMTDIDRFLRVVRAIDSPWFGANLDSGNFAPTSDPYADFARVAPYALNVQFKTMIPVNGEKEPADFARLVTILREANYRGFIVLEYEEPEDPYKEVPKYINSLRELIA